MDNLVKHLQPVLALVVPCYNEELVIGETAIRLLKVISDLVQAQAIDKSSFIYFVDDGSEDKTWSLMSELHSKNQIYKGLKLARNVGHQNALLAGLLNVKNRADCVITLDADLQHDEQAIFSFLEKYQQGADIVYGVRNDRAADSFFKKNTASLFYRLIGGRAIKNHADYRLTSKKALDALADYHEVNIFLRGLFVDIGLQTDIVYFNVRKRFAGKSKYSVSKMVSFALDGITSFSVVPLRLIALAGVIVFLFSVVMIFYALIKVLQGETIPGWASTVIPIYLIGGMQIIFMGLIGEYVGKIYKEVKARPRFIKDIELF